MNIFNSTPKTIGEIFDSLFKDIVGEENSIFLTLEKNWTNIVGEIIAKNVKPIRFSNNTLFLATTSSVWRTEINIRTEEIKKLINSYLEDCKIENIIVR